MRWIFLIFLLVSLNANAQSIPNFRKPLIVSHLSGNNKYMLTRPGAPKHNAISKAICFKYKCTMKIGWHKTQQRNKFKKYKKAGIPRLQYLKNDSIRKSQPQPQPQPTTKDPVVAPVATTVTPPIKKDSVVAYVFDDVLFDTNSAHLKGVFMDQLDTLAAHLGKYSNYDIRIVGHTDNSGNEKDNLRLSRHRAESVESYLATKGIDPEIIDAIGMGSKEPIADNITVEGRKKNRRVEIFLSFR